MASIYIIRHGQASFGSDNYDELSKLGCQQAEFLGQYFAASNIKFDAVYHGSLKRQRQTAEISMQASGSRAPLHVDARFNEIENDRQFEYLLPVVVKKNPELAALVEHMANDSKSYQKLLRQVFEHWVSPECDEPAIQSWSDYSAQVKDALTELSKTQGRGKTIGLFTSGGTIATIVSQVLGLGGEYAYRFYEPVVNVSITRLLYNETSISVSSYNDYSYLEMQSQSNRERLVTYR